MLSVYAGNVNRHTILQQMQQAVPTHAKVSATDRQTMVLTQKVSTLQQKRTASFSVSAYQSEPTRVKSAKEKKLSAEELKKLKYNFKQISAQLLRTKTSASAGQVVTKARNKVAQLKRQLKNGEEPSEELMSAITHAMQIQRVAEKRKKHLEQEEKIQRKSDSKQFDPSEQKRIEGNCDEEPEDALEQQLSALSDEIESKQNEETQNRMQESMEEMQLQMEEMMRQLQESMEEVQESFQADMQEMLEEMFGGMLEEAGGMDMLSELTEGMPGTLAEEMEPQDLEQLKKKHRCEEQRDIMEADMKYLKAMFDRLEKEKGNGACVSAEGTSAGAGNSSGDANFCNPGFFFSVSSQPDAPLMQETAPVTSEGANVDVSV